MKPIINIDFSDEMPLNNCAEYLKEVSSTLKNEDCYIIGTFKLYMEIKEIFGDNIILKFNDKDYTAAEIINILEAYENGTLK